MELWPNEKLPSMQRPQKRAFQAGEREKAGHGAGGQREMGPWRLWKGIFIIATTSSGVISYQTGQILVY